MSELGLLYCRNLWSGWHARCTWGKWQLTDAYRRCLAPRQKMEGKTNMANLLAKLWQLVFGQLETLRWTMSANRPWKDLLSLGATKSIVSLNCWNCLSNTLGPCFTLGTPGWHQVVFPHYFVLMLLSCCEQFSSLLSSLAPGRNKNKSNPFIHFLTFFDTSKLIIRPSCIYPK